MYYLLVENLITPFVMILVGYIFKKHPASDMNPDNGYNTPASRKTRERWDYAQNIAPGIFISLGKILCVTEIILSVAMAFLHVPVHTALIAGGVAGVGFLILAFYKTDSEIEKKFKEK